MSNTAELDRASELVEQARERIDDRTHADVAAWKAEHPGALAIGYMPIYVPTPLLEAMGILPVGVFGGGEQIDIIRGDSFFQSYICHIPRSTIELGLAGDLDALDGMIFPSICDVIRNLGGMWKMLFPEKWVAYLDLPQNFAPDIGGRFYGQELRRLARELHERGADKLEPDRLRAAIEADNERRRGLRRVEEVRRVSPWKVPAWEAYLIARAGTRMWATDHARLIDEYLASANERKGRPLDNVRVVVVGSFCEQPPLTLIRTLERAGCDIVADDYQLGLHYITGDIELAGVDPVDALADAFISKGVETASRYIGDSEKGEALITRVREVEADGVVFAAASFCDPALLDQPMLEAALQREGIPFTGFKYAENTGQLGVIREQAGAFSDSVKLWGAAT